MFFVGVDAHKKTSRITVMDDAGKILKRQRVLSTPGEFRQSLAEFSGPMKAVLEASYCWGPMYDWLDDLTDEVVLAHPGEVRAIAEARIKTDKIDSETLATWATLTNSKARPGLLGSDLRHASSNGTTNGAAQQCPLAYTSARSCGSNPKI